MKGSRKMTVTLMMVMNTSNKVPHSGRHLYPRGGDSVVVELSGQSVVSDLL